MSDEYNYGPLEHQMAGGTDRSEFDQVFDQMAAPEYPATCDNCGEVGTNASMEQHECDEHDAPAAPERGDQPRAWMRRWAYESKPCPPKVKNAKGRWEWPKESQFKEVTNVKIFADDVPLFAVEQHSTLMAQRERLLEAARFALSTPGFIRGRDSLQRIVDEAITTSEQEGRTER